jgi:hypothetical protein
LVVFNTSRESYGLANRRAAAMMATSSVPTVTKTIIADEGKTNSEESGQSNK